MAKTGTTLQASTSVAAGGTQESVSLDLSTKEGAVLFILLTNGATGPTVAMTATVQVSSDDATWRTFWVGTGGVVANGVYPFVCEIPREIMYVRVRFAGNTGQAVTVEALAQDSD